MMMGTGHAKFLPPLNSVSDQSGIISYLDQLSQTDRESILLRLIDTMKCELYKWHSIGKTTFNLSPPIRTGQNCDRTVFESGENTAKKISDH